ncbi:hypothetical protein ACNJX9_31145 [Bradyrhizobium sp. DASA03076]|uniref:hypothetical protein n=1 Tax=Bradyrhizobium sp. BLXBL-03 TaxID=3395916 RepID=UPI003F714DEC
MALSHRMGPPTELQTCGDLKSALLMARLSLADMGGAAQDHERKLARDTLHLFLTFGFAAGYANRYLQSRRIRRRLDAATVILQTHGYFLD